MKGREQERWRPRADEQANGQMMMGPLKIPPAWSPQEATTYPFRSWVRDISLWSIATDMPVEQQGAAVILRLGGAARGMCAEIEPHVVRDGTYVDDGNGNVSGPMARGGGDWVVGTFVAGAATESFFVSGAIDPGLSGLIVRDLGVVPEPSSALLSLVGLLGLTARRRR